MIVPIVVALVAGLIATRSFSLESIFPARRVAVVTGEWGPTSLPDETDGGPAGAFVKTVLAMAGYEADIAFMPWETAYSRVQHGEAFAAVPVVWSAQRARDFTLSAGFFGVEYRIFYNQAKTPLDSMSPEEITASSTAFLAGYDYWPTAEEDFPNHYPSRSTAERLGAEEAFRRLAAGEVTFVIEGLAQGEFIINGAAFPGNARDFKTVRPETFQRAGLQYPTTAIQLHLLLPKKTDEAVVEKINAAIEGFKQSDEYTRLAAAANGCRQDNVTITDGDEAIRPVSGSELIVPNGSAATVLAWPGTEDRCATATVVAHPTPNSALVKITSGPGAGALAMVPIQRLQLQEKQ